MLQLNEVALVTFSATSDGTSPKRHTRPVHKRKRIWFLLLKFKAKHRARQHQTRPSRTDTIFNPNRMQHVSPAKIGNDYNFTELDTFHRASKSILFIGQFFGMLPVQNILTDNPYDVHFHFKSYPMLFTLIFFVFGTLRVLNFTKKALENGVSARNFVAFIFFYSNLSTFFRFIYLAKNMPKLLRHWTRVELIFLMPPYEPVAGWTLRRKIQTLAISFIIIALFEHSLYFASSFYNYHMLSIYCQNKTNDTENGSFKVFIRNQFKDLFFNVPYNHVLAGYALFLNASFTFIWNYLDVFIMIISLSLALRFQQLAKRMQNLQGHFVSEELWYELRQHHIQLCELMERIDSNCSGIVLISCFINSYFICNQLLNIFLKLRWPINYVYFWFSLLYLIGRTSSVFLCASKIHDASLLPLRSLYLVPSIHWSEEVQRFYAQIRDEPIALTGKRFFQMTRKSLFGFMTSMIAYEFMLLQFDSKNWKSGLTPLCQ